MTAKIAKTTKTHRTPKTDSYYPATTKVPKFLLALYTMLEGEDSSVLSWSPDGACFQVHDIMRLEREVLPKYFKHGRLASFQRQLNNFGFRKWTKTRANVCTFSHDVLVQCHLSCLSGLVDLYHETKSLSLTTAASPRTLKRQRDHDFWPACSDGVNSKRASVYRETPCCGRELGGASGTTSVSNGAHTACAWIFDSIDVADVDAYASACACARALDWDRGASNHLFGADFLLEPLAMDATCEPIDWELVADYIAFADVNLAVSASVHAGRACSIQTSC